MPIKLYPDKKVIALCSMSPNGHEDYWLSVYVAQEETLTDVTAALYGHYAEIDQAKHLSYHTKLHDGNNYGDTETDKYLHDHDQEFPHKHYKLESEDFQGAETLLKALIT